jgi:putative acetyltransferase
MEITIRNENANDFRIVEDLTREAFWNLYVPGCNEHYLVHVLRNHVDFISDLDFVAIYKDKIIVI